jgi:hypothetical protein
MRTRKSLPKDASLGPELQSTHRRPKEPEYVNIKKAVLISFQIIPSCRYLAGCVITSVVSSLSVLMNVRTIWSVLLILLLLVVNRSVTSNMTNSVIRVGVSVRSLILTGAAGCRIIWLPIRLCKNASRGCGLESLRCVEIPTIGVVRRDPKVR